MLFKNASLNDSIKCSVHALSFDLARKHIQLFAILAFFFGDLLLHFAFQILKLLTTFFFILDDCSPHLNSICIIFIQSIHIIFIQIDWYNRLIIQLPMNLIEKGIKVNQKYNEAEQYAKKIEGISRATNWFETKTKYEGARRLIEEQKKSEKEMQFGRQELVIRRSTRLQALYQKQYEEWEGRLREVGLAIFKNKA